MGVIKNLNLKSAEWTVLKAWRLHLLCISISFWVRYFFSAVFNLFCSFQTFFSDFEEQCLTFDEQCFTFDEQCLTFDEQCLTFDEQGLTFDEQGLTFDEHCFTFELFICIFNQSHSIINIIPVIIIKVMYLRLQRIYYYCQK